MSSPSSSSSPSTDPKNTVFIIQHGPRVVPSYVTVFLNSISQPYHVLDITQPNAQWPDMETPFKAVISLGGPEGAYEEDKYPYLTTEKNYIRQLATTNIPFLGICLGCQLLADALGGKGFPSSHFEVGFPLLTPTEEGLRDPVLSQFFSTQEDGLVTQIHPILAHHGDTFSLPPSAQLLAKTEFPHAFRLNHMLGVQFHPEASVNDITAWAEFAQPRYIQVGKTKQQVLTEAQTYHDRTIKAAQVFFTAWWNNDVLKKKTQ